VAACDYFRPLQMQLQRCMETTRGPRHDGLCQFSSLSLGFQMHKHCRHNRYGLADAWVVIRIPVFQTRLATSCAFTGSHLLACPCLFIRGDASSSCSSVAPTPARSSLLGFRRLRPGSPPDRSQEMPCLWISARCQSQVLYPLLPRALNPASL